MSCQSLGGFPQQRELTVCSSSTFYSRQKRENLTLCLETGLGREREDQSVFRVVLCVSRVSVFLCGSRISGKTGRSHSFCREERSEESSDTQFLSAYTTSELGIISDSNPWGIGEQRLPFPSKGLAANMALGRRNQNLPHWL